MTQFQNETQINMLRCSYHFNPSKVSTLKERVLQILQKKRKIMVMVVIIIMGSFKWKYHTHSDQSQSNPDNLIWLNLLIFIFQVGGFGSTSLSLFFFFFSFFFYADGSTNPTPIVRKRRSSSWMKWWNQHCFLSVFSKNPNDLSKNGIRGQPPTTQKASIWLWFAYSLGYWEFNW